MSIVSMIIGESGTGKTTSLRHLDPRETLLVMPIHKPLPFKSSGWSRFDKEGNKEGNIFITDNPQTIVPLLYKTKREIIVLDDFIYLLVNELMRRSTERGYDKFTDIARRAFDIFDAAINIQQDKRIYIMTHSETSEHGFTRIRTVGKMINEKLVLEGMVSTVLKSVKVNGNYLFATQNSGNDIVKTPMGLFESEFIDNDLLLVDTAIKDYYNIQTKKNSEKQS